MSPEIRQFRLAETTDEKLAEYRSLSGWAVTGLIFGLLSPLALVDPLLWTVPIAGVLVCGRALWIIKQNAPELVGRKLALAGLWLIVLSLTAAPADWLCYRWRMRSEARQTALFWFELLAKNRPEMAYQLTLTSKFRQPLDERLWAFYQDTNKFKWLTILKNYVAPAKPDEPPRLVRTLLALGDSAQVRYLKTLDQQYIGSEEVLDQLYAVTFDDSGQKKTFFAAVRLARERTGNDHASWTIIDAQGGVDRNGKNKTQG
jgi:hypothetical protein